MQVVARDLLKEFIDMLCDQPEWIDLDEKLFSINDLRTIYVVLSEGTGTVSGYVNYLRKSSICND